MVIGQCTGRVIRCLQEGRMAGMLPGNTVTLTSRPYGEAICCKAGGGVQCDAKEGVWCEVERSYDRLYVGLMDDKKSVGGR